MDYNLFCGIGRKSNIIKTLRQFDPVRKTRNQLLEEIGAIVMPFDEQQAHLANEASRRYGKGQGHPAQLNMGDCAVYALAKLLDEPLLFVGNDFSQTDIKQC
jgi:ribonuclease VapC